MKIMTTPKRIRFSILKDCSLIAESLLSISRISFQVGRKRVALNNISSRGRKTIPVLVP